MDDTSQNSTLTKDAQEANPGISSGVQEDLKKTVPYYKLFSFADSIDKALMTVGTVGAIGNGLAQPLMALLFGEVIDAFGGAQRNDTASRVSKVTLKFIYLALGCGVAAFIQVFCWMITGERQAGRIRSCYLKAILRQEIAYFDMEVTTGEVIGRMSGDMILLQNAIGEKVGKFIQVVAAFLVGFVIAFVRGWLLALVLLSLFPLIIMSGVILHFLTTHIAVQSQEAYANAANLVKQTIGSIRTVASFSGEKQAVANYKKSLASSYKSDMSIALNSGLDAGFGLFLMFSGIGLGIWFGTKMILHKGYTGGQVFTILLAVVLGSSYLGHAYSSMAIFSTGQAVAFKMFTTINRKPTMDVYDDTKGKILNHIRGDIELRDVCFCYPSRPKEIIFNGFSLFIPSGTTMALVGQSGSGKSTVINLIERFYDPQSGEILIDGINLKEFQLKWIRLNIGLVSQEPVLFTASIRDNIAYGKDGATLGDIIVAAKLANAHDFIDKLPQGLDTRVGENGIQLSGGQKQRIAIARAILKEPRILLLDEATSALDADSERVVQEALENFLANRTTVIIAHRLNTIRNANTITVLHQGKIVEKGTHAELLKESKGVYSMLVTSLEVNEVMEQSMEYESEMMYRQRIPSMPSPRLGSYGKQSTTTNSVSMSITTSTLADDDIPSLETRNGIREVSIFQLAYLNKPGFPILIAAIVFAIISGAILPIYAILISGAIKSFYELPHTLKKDAEFWALMLFILGVVSLIAHPSRTYLFGKVGNKLIQRIRLKCFEKVVNMEIGWFDHPKNSSGVISAMLSDDVAKVRALVGDSLADYVEEAASIAIGLIVAFEASWILSLIVVAMIPLIGFNIYVQIKSLKGFGRDDKVKYDEVSQVGNDAISNIRIVASFCAQDMITEIHEKKYRRMTVNGRKQGLICGVGFGLSICFLYLVYAIIFYTGARFVQDGRIIASDVFRVYYALAMVSIAISSSSSLAIDSNKAKCAVASIFAILDRKSNIDPSNESGILLENFNGNIELNHVNFSYPTRSGVQILRDFSLTIHHGQVVALVGESGSGKSTVISLLQRFYNPNSGHITLDGIEIYKFQVKWLRQQMGLVSQESILFNDTIRANIAIGKAGSATEAEIIIAAKLANAHEFISSLQQGYDTIVGECGVQLSGGQKQRLAIARAIVKNPRILLLDEATSALDSESEKVVQEALEKVMWKKTTIVVAHRLSTIKEADEIVVLKNGSIEEKGNHNTLMDIKDGVYSALVRLHMNGLS